MVTYLKICPNCGSEIRRSKESKRNTLCCKSCGTKVCVMGDMISFKRKVLEPASNRITISESQAAALKKTGLLAKKRRWRKTDMEEGFHPAVWIPEIIFGCIIFFKCCTIY